MDRADIAREALEQLAQELRQGDVETALRTAERAIGRLDRSGCPDTLRLARAS